MSAVIYAAIVVMWAVVLVPMWLRRHDDETQPRSADRFSTAMRILSRRSSTKPGSRAIVKAPRESAASGHGSAGSARKAPAGRPVQPVPTSRAVVPATSIVLRRRRMLLGLLGLTALTVMLAVARAVPWPLQIIVDVVLIAFVIHLRVQARRVAAASRRNRRVPAAPPGPGATVAPRTRPAARRTERSRRRAPDPAQPGRAVEVTGTDGVTRTWVPVPVPPPTYTLKPPAPTAAALANDEPTDEEPVETASAADGLATDAVASDHDGILERRRAVND